MFVGIGRKSIYLILLMLVWPVVFLFSQAAPVSEGPTVFAPFVSRLTAEVRNNLVRLSWLDSPVVRGPVTIYCADSPINTDAIAQSQIRPIEVPYGVQFYVDETYSTMRYYYIVAADESGAKYYLPLPSNNMISVNVHEEAARPTANIPASQLSSVGNVVFSLEAAVLGEGIEVSFEAVGGGRNLVLYRSSRPLRQKEDLLRAVIVQSDIASPFVDYPVPGIAYYYALIPQDEIVRGAVALMPGDNATIAPVMVPASQYGMREADSPDMRSMPLPLMLITNLVPWNGSAGNFPATELSPRAARAVADIQKAAAASPAKKPRAFKEDMETPASGEQDVLRSAVQGPFAKRDWQAVKDQLGRFLSLPRNEDAEARAHFYLGQAYYFSNQPRQSLFEFLLAKPLYPQEAKEWIDASLGLIIDKGEEPR